MSGASNTIRPARPADLKQVRTHLTDAIDSSPFYGERFKEYEKSRFSEDYLRALIAVDPWHVALSIQSSEIAGLLVTTPELGTLWSPWVYIVPRYQTKALGIALIRFMIRHWDNGRFHKISCYVRPDNHTPLTVYKHFGFSEIALLKTHVFGEDLVLMERPLNKTVPGYDTGVKISRLRLLRLRLGDVFGASA